MVNFTDEVREIELELTDTAISIGSKNQKAALKLPKSMILLKSLATTSYCRSVSYYKGNTYVGLYNKTIEKVEADYKVTPKFIMHSGYSESVLVHRNRIYILSPASVSVYNMSGRAVTSWLHSDEANVNKMAIIGDSLVIPDRSSQRLVVYSFSGEVKRCISLQLSRGYLAICSVDDDSVIISDNKAGKVSRVDVTKGEVVWTSAVYNPEGVTSYGCDYVLVAAGDGAGIRILGADTGGSPDALFVST